MNESGFGTRSSRRRERTPQGFLRIHSADLVREVEQMAAAGLVDASLAETNAEACAVIHRVTDSGQAFLRAFKQPPELAELRSAKG